ncbi:hypothetical protein [Nocardioides conyzicola]|uniref:Uncharacterized protein n=1 Tax=Nocardioides conyzicola TaxID=1651781 RepID=A0ABP8X3A2_9ACTN
MQVPAKDRARVLITVKAYPQLSKRNRSEVVCVAGVRLDRGKPEWIRLFPVPFRDLPAAARFRKYQIVDVDVRRGVDARPESHHADFESIEVVESLESGRDGLWAARRAKLGDLLGDMTACEILKANVGGGPAPSLALVKPAEVLDVEVKVNPGFDAEQIALAEMLAEVDLFGDDRPSQLEPMPYLVKYRYRCLSSGCPTHAQTLIDWEVGQAGRDWSSRYERSEIPGRIREKFLDKLCGDQRDPYFYLGNQKLHLRTFMVLGVWWPKKAPLAEEGLF